MINNRKSIKCHQCGRGRHEQRDTPMSAQDMHKLTGLPLAGWSENRLDADYKRLRRPDRPTRGEIVDLALDSPRGTGPAK
jgi:hypothetical protein